MAWTPNRALVPKDIRLYLRSLFLGIDCIVWIKDMMIKVTWYGVVRAFINSLAVSTLNKLVAISKICKPLMVL